MKSINQCHYFIFDLNSTKKKNMILPIKNQQKL